MIRREHLGQSAPETASNVWRVDGLRIIRTVFERGQWVATRIPARGSYAEWESAHMQTAGESHEEGGQLPAIGAGWMSRADHTVLEPGDYKRVFDTPSEYWCCLSTAERSAGSVDCVGVLAGRSLELLPNMVLFATHGRFTVGGDAFQAPYLLRVRSTGKRLVAVTDSSFFEWR